MEYAALFKTTTISVVFTALKSTSKQLFSIIQTHCRILEVVRRKIYYIHRKSYQKFCSES